MHITRKLLHLLLLWPLTLPAATTPSVDAIYQHLKNKPVALKRFLKAMPKGGDLHNHLAGAVYPEALFAIAQADNSCISPDSLTVHAPPCPKTDQLDHLTAADPLTDRILDAWSMRHFDLSKHSGHDHFFATFLKFFPVVVRHRADLLANIWQNAARNHINYLELMINPADNAAGQLGASLPPGLSFEKLEQRLLADKLPATINKIKTLTRTMTANARQRLNCENNPTQAACHITTRYIYMVYREQAPNQVFASLLAGFKVAAEDPQFVGINLVQPEDGKITMRDYKRHMQMIGYLHQRYPSVHISLHAGELTKAFVSDIPPHIKQAIEIAGAERIGHGVDIAWEPDSKNTLKTMAKKNILVEINLTSNADILGLIGQAHPLHQYLATQVPVALSTDDQGVLGTDLSQEYFMAANTQDLSYQQLKMLDRNSLTYSFLPGKSLWDRFTHTIIPACRHDWQQSKLTNRACKLYLKQNKKAQLAWRLEMQLKQFEQNMTRGKTKLA